MKTLLTLTIAFLILLAPASAFAQNDVSPDGIYQGSGLIPCGQNMDNKCNSCHVVILANTVIKWLIGITFMIFAGMAVYSGVKLVISGGNSHAKEDAKSMFTNAFIGLFIILAAWLMVDTLLRAVLKNGETGKIDGYGPWSQVKCVTETEAGIVKLTIEEKEFEAEMIIRTTASGDNKSTLSGSAIDSRVAAIRATPAVTQLSDAALDRAGITDPAQRKAFRALISQESTNCQSKTGPDTGKGRGRAYGCVQILVGTARELDAISSRRFVGKTDAQVAEILLNDNAYSIQLGAVYYKQGLQKYGSIESALARYNGGDAALKPSKTCPGQTLYQCTANGGYAQTRNYVANITAVAARL